MSTASAELQKSCRTHWRRNIRQRMGFKKFVAAKFLDFKMVDNKTVTSQVQELQIVVHNLLAEWSPAELFKQQPSLSTKPIRIYACPSHSFASSNVEVQDPTSENFKEQYSTSFFVQALSVMKQNSSICGAHISSYFLQIERKPMFSHHIKCISLFRGKSKKIFNYKVQSDVKNA